MLYSLPTLVRAKKAPHRNVTTICKTCLKKSNLVKNPSASVYISVQVPQIANPLILMNDQERISHNSVNAISSGQGLRIKKNSD